MATDRLAAVLTAIDNINAQDPNQTLVDSKPQPKELIYAQQMTATLAQHWPDADELLQIAVHGQHIKRWSVKRDEYELGKAGYLKWRKALAVLHADLTQSIMLAEGYDDTQAAQTGAVIRKEKLRSDPRAQTLEDVACLVFLSHNLGEFAAKHDDAKVIDILQKTWRKMSDKGHEITLSVKLADDLAALVNKALA
ncbi:MAG: hypothetical protein ACI8WB_004820 [Phenylobacterium sp.]|jgi:hypothetical protein